MKSASSGFPGRKVCYYLQTPALAFLGTNERPIYFASGRRTFAMPEDKPRFEDRVAEIRMRFLETIPDRLKEIREAIQTPENSDPEETQLRKAHRMLHDMTGSAAMLELDHIEGAFRRALRIAEVADAKNTPFNSEELVIINDALADILDVLGQENASAQNQNQD
ncbi:Hpt domain-containing protein [Citreicella sp. C3M06]|uniref:Hpt domain-containing protein n=1 Tax=Citreicella sp. C3M06 TaxID=2841564 RepID=UPI001C08E7A4|nr:Hpt domain-containing protein [Citreicella sp. C3M06]MBU2961601.1 Hpt domain-containing protein [Citreicella sp. C3M06]